MTDSMGTGDFGVFGPLANRLLHSLDLDSVSGSNRELLCEVLRFAARAEHELGSRQMALAKMEAQSLLDPVTGVENHRGLKLAFGRAAAAAGRYGSPSVLIILAIEGLDDIRAEHNEAGENFVLHRIVDELRVMTRRSDVIARISHHEFALLLTHCPTEHATSKTAQLVASLGRGFSWVSYHTSVSYTRLYNAPLGGVSAYGTNARTMSPGWLVRRIPPRLGALVDALVALNDG